MKIAKTRNLLWQEGAEDWNGLEQGPSEADLGGLCLLWDAEKVNLRRQRG